jgi:hypothetical protein
MAFCFNRLVFFPDHLLHAAGKHPAPSHACHFHSQKRGNELLLYIYILCVASSLNSSASSILYSRFAFLYLPLRNVRRRLSGRNGITYSYLSGLPLGAYP